MITDRHDLYRKERVEGNREFDYLSTRLTILDMRTSRRFRIPKVAESRPDLISYSAYGNVDLWWLIMEHNNIIDPIDELYAGRIIEIPSLDNYYDFYDEFARKNRRD